MRFRPPVSGGEVVNRRWGGRGEYLVLLQGIIFLAFVLTPAWNPLVTASLLSETSPIRWAGLAAFGGAALALGGLGALQIRRYLTPLPYPVDHNRLVQHGVYAVVRHPLYSSLLAAGLGWTVFTLSLSHLLLLALAFVFFDFKATKEEQWLTERHPEYAGYAKRVKKFIPGVY